MPNSSQAARKSSVEWGCHCVGKLRKRATPILPQIMKKASQWGALEVDVKNKQILVEKGKEKKGTLRRGNSLHKGLESGEQVKPLGYTERHREQ
jgi:hypothetical protein